MSGGVIEDFLCLKFLHHEAGLNDLVEEIYIGFVDAHLFCAMLSSELSTGSISQGHFKGLEMSVKRKGFEHIGRKSSAGRMHSKAITEFLRSRVSRLPV